MPYFLCAISETKMLKTPTGDLAITEHSKYLRDTAIYRSTHFFNLLTKENHSESTTITGL